MHLVVESALGRSARSLELAEAHNHFGFARHEEELVHQLLISERVFAKDASETIDAFVLDVEGDIIFSLVVIEVGHFGPLHDDAHPVSVNMLSVEVQVLFTILPNLDQTVLLPVTSQPAVRRLRLQVD